MGSMSDATENHDDVPGWGDADPEAFERLARIWDALGCGPLWLERSTPDPLFDPLTRRALLGEKPQPSVAPAVSSAPATSQPAPAPRFGRPTQAAGAPAPQHPRAPQSAWGTQSASQAVPQTYQPHQTPQAAPAYIPVLPEGTNAKIRTADWATLEGLVRGCTACPMSKTRQNPVFAEGAPGPKLVLVGEAPGAEEDLQGIPFVGKSGKLLTAMLDAIAVRRKEDVVILNALKCRPPQNRNPEPAETACSLPRAAVRTSETRRPLSDGALCGTGGAQRTGGRDFAPARGRARDRTFGRAKGEVRCHLPSFVSPALAR